MIEVRNALETSDAARDVPGWACVLAADTSLWVETRRSPLNSAAAAHWLDAAPKALSLDWPLASLLEAMREVEAALRADVIALATRFATLMGVDAVRVRIEALTSDACTRLRADYTDMRLISTYAGPGTDYVTGNDRAAPLQRLLVGAIGLFKGHSFGAGHAPCLHRSPPISTSGERRLMLVIDTPLRHTMQ